MNLLNYTLEKIIPKTQKEEKYGFKLIHNRVYCELFARNEENLNKWIESLKMLCVLTNYSANLTNIHLIGRGNSAKVILHEKVYNQQ